MIINVPSADGLNNIALRLYFSAWSSLAKIYDDFHLAHRPYADWKSTWPGASCANEWLEYTRSCQPDLHAICTVIQQSQELALKARIANLSPYLLLIRTENRFSQLVKDIDFSTLRTLDAIELPGAVNTLCHDTLSDRFVQTYERIRTLRNQIAHLGAPTLLLQPAELLEILFEQFSELWEDKKWLRERRNYCATSRLGYFYDGSNTSAAMEVLQEMPYLIGMIRPAHFKRLFGHSKSSKRFLCPSCFHDGRTDYADLDLTQCTTAFLSEDRKRVVCAMCESQFSVTEGNCGADDCAGTFRCSSTGEFEDVCLTCGT